MHATGAGGDHEGLSLDGTLDSVLPEIVAHSGEELAELDDELAHLRGVILEGIADGLVEEGRPRGGSGDHEELLAYVLLDMVGVDDVDTH